MSYEPSLWDSFKALGKALIPRYVPPEIRFADSNPKPSPPSHSSISIFDTPQKLIIDTFFIDDEPSRYAGIIPAAISKAMETGQAIQAGNLIVTYQRNEPRNSVTALDRYYEVLSRENGGL